MKNTVVLYHGGCPDGMTAAWAAWKYFQNTAEYHPVWYNEPIPADLTDKVVYIVDFSYKRPELQELCAKAKHVTVLDHHKTARDELAGLELPNLNVTFDMSKSGAMLTWEHFFPGEKTPLFVKYIQDRDLWLFKLAFSHEVSALVMSYPKTLEAWQTLAFRFTFADDDNGRLSEYDLLVREGVGILRYQTQMVKDMADCYRWCVIGGHVVKCASAPVLWSEVAGTLACGEKFGLSYLFRANGIKQYSLRVRDGHFDVSALAKQYGGGGHTQAAGFEVLPDQHDPVYFISKKEAESLKHVVTGD